MLSTLDVEFIGILLTDINECTNDKGNCSQQCINLVGSFECKCDEGYELQRDHRSCKGRLPFIMASYMFFLFFLSKEKKGVGSC